MKASPLLPVPITLPDLGAARVVLSLWHVRPGERVYAGDRVVEVLIPGAVIDVSAPATGTVRDQLARTNDVLAAGQVLGTIEPEGGEVD